MKVQKMNDSQLEVYTEEVPGYITLSYFLCPECRKRLTWVCSIEYADSETPYPHNHYQCDNNKCTLYDMIQDIYEKHPIPSFNEKVEPKALNDNSDKQMICKWAESRCDYHNELGTCNHPLPRIVYAKARNHIKPMSCMERK